MGKARGRIAGIGRGQGGGGVHGAEQHFFGAASGRNEADAGLDQADVGFGVGLAADGMQANLRAAAEREAKRRNHHRARTELDGRGHLLEAVNDGGQFFPLAFLGQQQKLHQVGADREIVTIAGDDEAGKIADRIGGWVENGGDEGKHVAADGVLERVKLDAGDGVAKIDQRCACVGADDLVGAAEIGDAGVAGPAGMVPLRLWWACSTAGRSEEYQERRGFRPESSRLQRARLTGRPRVFMRATVERRRRHPTFRRGQAPS